MPQMIGRTSTRVSESAVRKMTEQEIAELDGELVNEDQSRPAQRRTVFMTALVLRTSSLTVVVWRIRGLPTMHAGRAHEWIHYFN